MISTPTRVRVYTATVSTHVGVVLLAATERGVCGLAIGDDRDELESWAREEFADAEVDTAADHLGPWLATVRDHVADGGPVLGVPLDVRGTAFRRRVWDELRRIPYGQSRTYTQVAASLGCPSAVRAVARACATNPASLVVPCHRVVGSDGSLRGYRWGLDRKRALLERERQIRAAAVERA